MLSMEAGFNVDKAAMNIRENYPEIDDIYPKIDPFYPETAPFSNNNESETLEQAISQIGSKNNKESLEKMHEKATETLLWAVAMALVSLAGAAIVSGPVLAAIALVGMGYCLYKTISSAFQMLGAIKKSEQFCDKTQKKWPYDVNMDSIPILVEALKARANSSKAVTVNSDISNSTELDTRPRTNSLK